MGYAWTACRRCGRTLKKGGRDGLGPECAAKATEADLKPRGRLMNAVDRVLDNLDQVHEAVREITRRDALLVADSLEHGRYIPPRLSRLIQKTAYTIKVVHHA